MARIVEKTGRTYETAVEMALTELGIPLERAVVLLLRARDLDRRTPGPEEYTVRVWERSEEDVEAMSPDVNVSLVQPVVCEKTADSYEDAVRLCLTELGIEAGQADIQIIQREDTNPLKAGPERITVRVWRRRLMEPAPDADTLGREHVQDLHAAAHLPDDSELDFESPSGREDQK